MAGDVVLEVVAALKAVADQTVEADMASQTKPSATINDSSGHQPIATNAAGSGHRRAGHGRDWRRLSSARHGVALGPLSGQYRCWLDGPTVCRGLVAAHVESERRID